MPSPWWALAAPPGSTEQAKTQLPGLVAPNGSHSDGPGTTQGGSSPPHNWHSGAASEPAPNCLHGAKAGGFPLPGVFWHIYDTCPPGLAKSSTSH